MKYWTLISALPHTIPALTSFQTVCPVFCGSCFIRFIFYYILNFIWSLINDEALLAADPFNEVIEAQRAAAVETKDPEQENYQLAESCV